MNMFGWNNNEQINFSVSTPSWKGNDSIASHSVKTETRATPITDASLGTDKTFGIIADIVNGSNYTTEINKEVVSYNTTNKIWETIADHYWPGANKTVNFYAYYPASITNGTITHTAGTTPTLTYTVPADATTQVDIITATANNISGSTNSSTPLTFSHIFAAVQFSIGSTGMPTGTITGITLNNILYKGAYNFNGTWTPDATSKTSFSQTVSVPTNAGASITSGILTFMMIPQTLGSDASITVTYSNGGTLTKSISGTWSAGKIYAFNISKTISATFNYTGNVQMYTIPLDGTYKIECWGAQGGCCDNGDGGKGGYTKGEILLKAGTTIYFYVGQNPSKNSLLGGWNGGGNGSSHADGNGLQTGCAGGGATDLRLVYSQDSQDFNSLKSRIMVAGGGSGTGYCAVYTLYCGIAGAGGGLNGMDGNDISQNGNLDYTASGGTQTSGGNTKNAFEYVDGDPNKSLIINSGLNKGGFGYGGTNNGYKSVLGGCAGGSGYYGGGAANRAHGGGGGGSSFISGYPGCNAIDQSSTSDRITHTGSPVHYSKYVFTNSQMIAGTASMPSPTGGTETGHTGNGYARITFVSAN
ncbi:fimbrillin family protein [Prevotella herbatica]|uniref:receptor protein-tyrosine kinase n=2 Tax=Prevotella herbatica TaxID=2801997 RepID=A0ABN6EME5_9BACT|nr:fimbrillin family protein [Prevotella herbatica]